MSIGQYVSMGIVYHGSADRRNIIKRMPGPALRMNGRITHPKESIYGTHSITRATHYAIDRASSNPQHKTFFTRRPIGYVHKVAGTSFKTTGKGQFPLSNKQRIKPLAGGFYVHKSIFGKEKKYHPIIPMQHQKKAAYIGAGVAAAGVGYAGYRVYKRHQAQQHFKQSVVHHAM